MFRLPLENYRKDRPIECAGADVDFVEKSFEIMQKLQEKHTEEVQVSSELFENRRYAQEITSALRHAYAASKYSDDWPLDISHRESPKPAEVKECSKWMFQPFDNVIQIKPKNTSFFWNSEKKLFTDSSKKDHFLNPAYLKHLCELVQNQAANYLERQKLVREFRRITPGSNCWSITLWSGLTFNLWIVVKCIIGDYMLPSWDRTATHYLSNPVRLDNTNFSVVSNDIIKSRRFAILMLSILCSTMDLPRPINPHFVYGSLELVLAPISDTRFFQQIAYPHSQSLSEFFVKFLRQAQNMIAIGYEGVNYNMFHFGNRLNGEIVDLWGSDISDVQQWFERMIMFFQKDPFGLLDRILEQVEKRPDYERFRTYDHLTYFDMARTFDPSTFVYRPEGSADADCSSGTCEPAPAPPPYVPISIFGIPLPGDVSARKSPVESGSAPIAEVKIPAAPMEVDLDERDECDVCMEKPKVVVNYPCKHQSLCTSCATAAEHRNHWKCYVCNNEVVEYITPFKT